MPDFKLKGNICELNTLIQAGDTYSKVLDIDGMAGAISIHLTTDADLNINMECSNIKNVFEVPNGWADIIHSTGGGFYEIAIPICTKARINLIAQTTNVHVTASVVGA